MTSWCWGRVRLGGPLRWGSRAGSLGRRLREGRPAGQDERAVLHEHTEIRLQLVAGYPDYHPEHLGGLPHGGRTLEPGLVSLDGLGDWGGRIGGDVRRMMLVETPLGGGTGVVAPQVLAEREQAQLEGQGRALVGGLLKACLAHGVLVRASSRGLRLLTQDALVRGVRLETPEGMQSAGGRGRAGDGRVRVRRGASARLPARAAVRAIGAPSNTGDGLRMAMRVGARLGNMREAWWSPVITLPGQRQDGGSSPPLARSRPRSTRPTGAPPTASMRTPGGAQRSQGYGFVPASSGWPASTRGSRPC